MKTLLSINNVLHPFTESKPPDKSVIEHIFINPVHVEKICVPEKYDHICTIVYWNELSHGFPVCVMNFCVMCKPCQLIYQLVFGKLREPEIRKNCFVRHVLQFSTVEYVRIPLFFGFERMQRRYVAPFCHVPGVPPKHLLLKTFQFRGPTGMRHISYITHI